MVQTPHSSPSPVGLNNGSSWNPLVVSLVVTICIVFLVLSYFTILKQMFRGFSHSRNPIGLQRLNEANPDDPSLQFHSHGLDSITVKSLPMVRFDPKARKEPSIMKNTECAVCLVEFEEDEQLKFLPYCSHLFHISCIDEWFQCHSTCPMCRSEVGDAGDSCSISVRSLIETVREDLVRDEGRVQSLRFEVLRSATTTNVSWKGWELLAVGIWIHLF